MNKCSAAAPFGEDSVEKAIIPMRSGAATIWRTLQVQLLCQVAANLRCMLLYRGRSIALYNIEVPQKGPALSWPTGSDVCVVHGKGAIVSRWGGARRQQWCGHEATDTGLAYAPVSQANGHNHIVQRISRCTAAQTSSVPHQVVTDCALTLVIWTLRSARTHHPPAVPVSP